MLTRQFIVVVSPISAGKKMNRLHTLSPPDPLSVGEGVAT